MNRGQILTILMIKTLILRILNIYHVINRGSASIQEGSLNLNKYGICDKNGKI